mmetsp:Transcript_15821/g.30958  ORF Transcript_15821/g.30958 Transcript_15821/m.30958 type:complete len:189 (-) Transcript_15821:134-700(-)
MSTLKEQVFDLLKDKDLETMTQKMVRRDLEKQQGLEEGALEDKRKEIKALVQEYVETHGPSGSESESEEEQPKKTNKKRKTAGDDAGEPTEKKSKMVPVKTKSGKPAPTKGLKQAQQSAMTGKKFEKEASELVVDVFGNTITALPRTFTSNNRGWYGGGKIEVKVGKKTLWAQLGLNVTIVGSKEWND